MEQQQLMSNERNWVFDTNYPMPMLITQLKEEPIQQDLFPQQQLLKFEDIGDQNKKKKVQQQPEDEMNLIKNNTDLFIYKNNLKNTYINKISSLMNQDLKQNNKQARTQQKQNQKVTKILNGHSEGSEYNYCKQSDVQKEQVNAKLLRNRECARNSRKRKKVYIELLETKVKTLNEELDKTKRILQTSSSYFSKISQDTQLQSFFLGRQQLYEKLDKAVQQEKDSNEIGLLLDSMRFRVGGGGKERINAANYFFNQILDICIPIHVRYLLWSAVDNKDLFYEQGVSDNQEQINTNTWSQNLIRNINVTDQQKKAILRSKKKLVVEKSKLEDLLVKFQDLKEQIYQKTSQVENFVDELRNTLTPVQTAQLLIGLERNKYRKEMHLSKLLDIFETNSENELDIKEENANESEELHRKIHY